MFNSQIIKDLLEERGLKSKDLLDYMGKNHNGSLKQILSGDVKASNLEKMADFFCVPIDTFFDRQGSNNGVFVGGVGNKVHHFNVQNAIQETQTLKMLLDEKEKRIKVLEDMVALLKMQTNI